MPDETPIGGKEPADETPGAAGAAAQNPQPEPGPKPARPKPLLTVEQQIAHMKSKGITFNFVTEQDAAAYLTSRTYLFKLYAFRTLFDKRVDGPRDGQYVGLDFGHLLALASLDRDLRYTLLPLTLDVEHFARVKLVREATRREGEDGYSITSDYLASLSHEDRRRRTGEVNAFLKDAYTGDLARKYALPGEMPLWAYLEMASFGTFVDLWLFCANRWEDEQMRHEHYMLRQTKSARNAYAHSSNVINGFRLVDDSVKPDEAVRKAVAQAGVSHRVRTSKLRNPRLLQIATVLHLHTRLVPEGTSKRRAREGIARLRSKMSDALEGLSSSDAARSSLEFLMALFDKWS